MCGIVGFTGRNQAAPVLLDGLSKLEYRGYDSAGIADFNVDTGKTNVVKSEGRLLRLSQKTDDGAAVPGTCGIGHTRWATHGEPSELNAHPHMSDDNNVVGVHNGIIENYQELKAKLQRKGYSFYSQTDTEVAVKLVDYYYKKYDIGPIDAIAKAMVRIRGSYALALMFKDYPGEIWAARKDSPMIIGIADGESYLASDVPAILNYTRSVYYIDNLEMARLTPDSVTFYNLDGDTVEKDLVEIEWDAEAAEKGGYEHFMLKEIHEQPRAVKDTLGNYVNDNAVNFSAIGLEDELLQKLERLYIIGCGSAYHVGVVGKYVLEDLADIPVEVDLASEFRYRNPVIFPDDVVIAISQSGETADTLAAVDLAHKAGALVMGVCNAIGASIPRLTQTGVYIHVGPEIGVASTKAFTGQVAVLSMLALCMARERQTITGEQYRAMVKELTLIPDKMEQTLRVNDHIERLSPIFTYARNCLYLGRGYNYPVALEGALKLKEISYIHAEGYPAAEMKHGPIALIDSEMPVFVIATRDKLYDKVVSNVQEVRARGGRVTALITEGDEQIRHLADHVIELPDTIDCFQPLIASIPLQLLAYHIAVCKGRDVDRPRNLAKSVTVE